MNDAGNAGLLIRAIVGAVLCLGLAGCRDAPGKPQTEAAGMRPEQVLDFPTLFKQNCAACHGNEGRQGAALALANPAYLATAGFDNLHHTVTYGLPGTLMPAFAKSQGGLLTDAQIDVLSNGMMKTWGASSAGMAVLPYASHAAGDAGQGRVAYATFCARCHGADATGSGHLGSLVDPAYLDLMDDQALRSTILAGRPDEGMPDWRTDSSARAMTDGEVTDTVAWIALHRTVAQTPRRATHE